MVAQQTSLPLFPSLRATFPVHVAISSPTLLANPPTSVYHARATSTCPQRGTQAPTHRCFPLLMYTPHLIIPLKTTPYPKICGIESPLHFHREGPKPSSIGLKFVKPSSSHEIRPPMALKDSDSSL